MPFASQFDEIPGMITCSAAFASVTRWQGICQANCIRWRDERAFVGSSVSWASLCQCDSSHRLRQASPGRSTISPVSRCASISPRPMVFSSHFSRSLLINLCSDHRMASRAALRGKRKQCKPTYAAYCEACTMYIMGALTSRHLQGRQDIVHLTSLSESSRGKSTSLAIIRHLAITFTHYCSVKRNLRSLR